MRTLVISQDVASRIGRALAESSRSRIQHARRLEGNPLGVEIRRWRNVVGTLVARPIWYYHYFNALKNVGPGDEVALDEGLAWLRSRHAIGRVAVSPFHASEGFLEGLGRRGLRTAQFQSVMVGGPETDLAGPPPGVAVRELRRDNFDPFLRQWIPTNFEHDRRLVESLVRAEFTDWRCYVAEVDGVAAGVAAMHVADDVAVLAGAGTRPEFRGRGCQTALLRRRTSDAHAAGCRLAVSQATPGSTSQRNMERLGFHTAYTEVILTDALVTETA